MNNDDKAYYVAMIVKVLLGALLSVVGAAISDSYLMGLIVGIAICICAAIYSDGLYRLVRRNM